MNPSSIVHLPWRGSVRGPALGSAALAVLLLTASGVAMSWTPSVYPTPALVHAFLPSDIVNVVVMLPFLLASVALALRGHLIGLLCWPAALFCIAYGYAVPLVDLPLGPLSLVHGAAVLLGVSLAALVLHRIDHDGVRRRLAPRAPIRTGAGVLLFLGVFLALRVGGLALLALTDNEGQDPLDPGLWLADALLATPALLASGLAGWWRTAIGYTTTIALLAAYGVLSVGLLPVFTIQASMTGTPVDLAGVVIVSLMALVCAVPFALAWRPRLTSDRSTA